jgi:RNA polymerase sigma-70 factor, ECF subfamily
MLHQRAHFLEHQTIRNRADRAPFFTFACDTKATARIYVMTMERATPQPQVTDVENQALDWNQIYLDLAPRVYNYFRYRLGQEREVEDLTSRTFERAWTAREQYRRDLAGFSTWLFKIAQNLIVDHVRSRRNHVSIDHALNSISNDITESSLERSSDLSRLASLTRELPPRDRELVALKYGAEMFNRDIARLTGLSESNVGSILHRLVQNLRARW